MSANRSGRFPQWALGIMGAVTLLALAILVLSLILGVRAGQNQLELRRRQEVGIALQKAVDLRAEGQLEAALAEYRKVLSMDPGNTAAGEGLESLLQTAMGVASGTSVAPVAGEAPVATTEPAASAATTPGAASGPDSQAMLRPQAVLAPAVTTAGVTATGVAPGSGGGPSVATDSPLVSLPVGVSGDLFTRAQTAFRAGRWQESIDLLNQVQSNPATSGNAQVTQLLFDAYINLAGEKDNEDNLESALALYDRALALKPTASDVLREQELISTYLDMQQAYDLDWRKTVDLLLQLFILDPQYRDVEDRLLDARIAYGDELAIDLDWCTAAAQYDAAAGMSVTTFPADLAAKQGQARATCANGGTPVAVTVPDSTPTTALAGAGALDVSAPILTAPTGRPTVGRILYSVRDPIDGRNRIWEQPVAGGAATMVAEDGAQPALRQDGARLAYRNVSSGQGGMSATDPASGVFFRITDYPEDVLPSWDPAGSRLAFASNREGDRRWRIYLAWAEEGGEVSTLGFGESPAYHPFSDLIVHRGCDASGNGCGLWLMDSSGGNRRPLTNVAGDNRPSWSPDGRSVVFTSDGRDGNPEIYRVDLANSQVTRLTDSSGLDVTPSVDPDGAWVAFLSNRDGGWKLWAVPLAGGAAQPLATLKGEVGDWNSQGVQWVY